MSAFSTPIPRRALAALLAALAAVPVALLAGRSLRPVSSPVAPLSAPARGLQVFHLGHSLVGPDIPHLLRQFAGPDHVYHVQRGSGTSLRTHWEPAEAILDFEQANPPELWREARLAIGSGDYDAVILTEMVELRDAIKYFDAARYFHHWAELARHGRPEVRLYLYETWHRLDDPEGWLERIDRDLEGLWLGPLLARDARRAQGQPVYLIPGGQALAAVTRAAESGEIPGLTTREALFARDDAGRVDPIHLSALGSYVIALTHYAVLYHRSPEGLPREVTLADGTRFAALSRDGATALQQTVWRVVTTLPRTGLAPAAGSSPQGRSDNS